MKYYLRLFLILVFVFFGYVLNVAQAEVPEDITQAHEAVWRLVYHGGYGTAFFIGPNQVVTNFHVITGIGEGYKYRSVENMYLAQGNKRLKISKILSASAVADLVILETEENVSEYLNVSQEDPAGRLFALGYPQGVRRTLIHSEEHEVIDRGHDYEMVVDITKLKSQFNPVNFGKMSRTSLYGLSGGPVLDGKEKVIGVAYSSSKGVAYGGSNKILYVIKVSQLEDLQEGHIGVDCSKVSLSFCMEQAIKDIKKRAEQKDVLAQDTLYLMYYHGIGVEEDKEKASELQRWFSSQREKVEKDKASELKFRFAE